MNYAITTIVNRAHIRIALILATSMAPTSLWGSAPPNIIMQETPSARLGLFISEELLANFPDNAALLDEQSRTILDSLSSQKNSASTSSATLHEIPPCGPSEHDQLAKTARSIASTLDTSPRELLLGTITAVKKGYSGFSLSPTPSQLFQIERTRSWPAASPINRAAERHTLILRASEVNNNIFVSGRQLGASSEQCLFIASRINGATPSTYSGDPLACMIADVAVLYFESEERCTIPTASLSQLLDREDGAQ